MGCLRLDILEQSFVPMKIVYKKYEEEHKSLGSHLGIDPLADGGGQQVLSPYHAMGCNPAMLIDPLGLQRQTGMSSPGNDHFIMPFGYMIDGTYVYLSANRLGTGKGNSMKRLEAYIYNSMMEMAEAKQQKMDAIIFAAALDMINGYNTALQSLVSSYDIRGMIGSQMKPGYLDGENNKQSSDGGKYPDYVMKHVKSVGMITSSTKSELPSGVIVLESTSDAWNHYMDGNGKSAVIGNSGLSEFETSSKFQKYVRRIITGKTSSMTGYLSVDLELQTFHIGRTNFNYDIKCGISDCIVKFNVFVNDGFWDVNYIFEGLGLSLPDGMGRNLEMFGGKPYYYIPRAIEYQFINPGYKPN